MPKSFKPSRRLVIMGGATLALGAGGYAVAQYVLRPSTVGALITPVEAHQLAQSGEITLVDIRRPDEWSRFGLGEGAHPLDMRRPDFTEALSVLVDGDHSQPVALICAGGVRSKYMTARLTEAGFTHIIDIPEGMMGSRVGPGWMRRGLPLTPWNAS